MSPRLISPHDLAALIEKGLRASWAARVCAEFTGEPEEPIVVGVRPGVNASSAVKRVGLDTWADWRLAWDKTDLDGLSGLSCERRPITVEKVTGLAPWLVRVEGLASAVGLLGRLGGPKLDVDLDRARDVASRLRDAGAALNPSALKQVCGLEDPDVAVVLNLVTWLRAHPTLGEWTTRQLPVPGMHTKWLTPGRESLVRSLLGPEVLDGTRPRLSVVHLTYVDPTYLATGGRRHDAWTTGDSHELAYRPRTVLVVENRDCRLWFEPFAEAVVVEGSGKAAAASLAQIDWLVGAEHLVYWGDIDADGFAILNNLRAELGSRGVTVRSLLMDTPTLERYVHLGVDRDKHGNALGPSIQRLPHLTPEEADCYARIATSGDVPVRRIEQERINIGDAVRALQAVVDAHRVP